MEENTLNAEEGTIERTWPILVAIISASFLTVLNVSTINIAIPALMNHFHADLTLIQWTITGFILAMGTTAPLSGYLGERFSTKRLFLISMIGFTLSSLLCAIAGNALSLIIYRILQGAFTGVVGPTAMTIVYQLISRRKQAFAISLWSLAAMLGPAIGPTLSGWIIEHLNWTWLFWINVPLGTLSIVLIAAFIPYYRINEPKKFDLVGLITVLIGSLSLLIAFSEANQWGWGATKTLSLMAIGCVMLVLFVCRELKVSAPLLSMKLFQYSRYTYTLIIASIITVSLYSGTLMTSLFLQNVQHITPVDTGLVLFPSSLAMALAMPLVGKLYEKFGPFWLVLSGITMIAVGTLALSWLRIDLSPAYIACWMTVRNVGFAFTMMPSSNAGMQSIPKQMAGHGSSMSNWIRNVAGSFSVALFTALLTSRMSSHSQTMTAAGGHDPKTIQLLAQTMGINDVFLVASLIAFLGLPITFFLRKKAAEAEPQASKVVPVRTKKRDQATRM